MPLPLIETGHCNVDLKPSPIKQSWIIDGNPEARSHRLSVSADGAATTVIWSCTEGKFNWYYDVDETIMILEGSIVIESDGTPPKRYGVGDVIFFRGGAHARWHVEGYVKKVAFCRQTNPIGFNLVIRAVNKLKRILVRMPARHALRLWMSTAILNGSIFGI
ncbi:cupin domain-containing protein [Bradyrhizobium sp. Tv2a-2]|uniref:cupin domain-containing protein n=1 Tax=Bradyrhizobium sp. Tv2a-2 TaxID=113395 RepID=UPI0003FA3F99|nr:cupin domain-containing protein [Bradyrhizobium sp. Tv2a-2]